MRHLDMVPRLGLHIHDRRQQTLHHIGGPIFPSCFNLLDFYVCDCIGFFFGLRVTARMLGGGRLLVVVQGGGETEDWIREKGTNGRGEGVVKSGRVCVMRI
jgi:hypothetical protein